MWLTHFTWKTDKVGHYFLVVRCLAYVSSYLLNLQLDCILLNCTCNFIKRFTSWRAPCNCMQYYFCFGLMQLQSCSVLSFYNDVMIDYLLDILINKSTRIWSWRGYKVRTHFNQFISYYCQIGIWKNWI